MYIVLFVDCINGHLNQSLKSCKNLFYFPKSNICEIQQKKNAKFSSLCFAFCVGMHLYMAWKSSFTRLLLSLYYVHLCTFVFYSQVFYSHWIALLTRSIHINSYMLTELSSSKSTETHTYTYTYAKEKKTKMKMT